MINFDEYTHENTIKHNPDINNSGLRDRKNKCITKLDTNSTIH